MAVYNLNSYQSNFSGSESFTWSIDLITFENLSSLLLRRLFKRHSSFIISSSHRQFFNAFLNVAKKDLQLQINVIFPGHCRLTFKRCNLTKKRNEENLLYPRFAVLKIYRIKLLSHQTEADGCFYVNFHEKN